ITVTNPAFADLCCQLARSEPVDFAERFATLRLILSRSITKLGEKQLECAGHDCGVRAELCESCQALHSVAALLLDFGSRGLFCSHSRFTATAHRLQLPRSRRVTKDFPQKKPTIQQAQHRDSVRPVVLGFSDDAHFALCLAARKSECVSHYKANFI